MKDNKDLRQLIESLEGRVARLEMRIDNESQLNSGEYIELEYWATADSLLDALARKGPEDWPPRIDELNEEKERERKRRLDHIRHIETERIKAKLKAEARARTDAQQAELNKINWKGAANKVKRFARDNIDIKRGRVLLHRKTTREFTCEVYAKVEWSSLTFEFGVECNW